MPAGRPTKYTPETTEKILDAIRVGTPLTYACRCGGVSFETMNEWRKQYPEFSEAIKQAESEGIKSCLDVITAAAVKGNWAAAAWRLERRYPHEFGRRDRMPIDERELDRQFREVLAGLEGGGEASVPASTESSAIN